MAVMTRRQPRIPLEELCRLPSFFFPQVSWKGDRVAFYWDKSGRIELYVMDLATKAVRQVSHGEVPRAMRTGFAWSRDDRFIAFGKDAGGNEQHDLYKIEVETEKVTQLTNDPAAEEHAVQFSPNDEWLTVDTNKRLPESPDRPGQLNIWKIRADGSDYTPLTRYAFPVFGGLWSDDGKWISYVTNEDMTNLKNRDGYVVDPDGSGARKIFSIRAGSQDTLGDWHPDGRRIAATSDASGQNRAGIVDIETGDVRCIRRRGSRSTRSVSRRTANGWSRSGTKSPRFVRSSMTSRRARRATLCCRRDSRWAPSSSRTTRSFSSTTRPM